MSFQSDLRKFNDKTKLQATRRIRRVALLAFRMIIIGTPVLTGCARGNWRISFGDLRRDFDMKSLDKTCGKTISRASLDISNAKVGVDVNICNSVHYIMALEDGYSRQAPNGMVGITCRTLKAQIDQGNI